MQPSLNMVQYFLVIPPGFESLAILELQEKWPGLEVSPAEKGGVSVMAPLEMGLSLCQSLKIPSAILLRIAEFKCRDLPKLYQKVSNIRWGQYLLGGQFLLSVASSKSRLLNEKKIEKAVAEGIERHFEKQPAKKAKDSFAFEVKVRFFQDICTLSLDICGEPLFKRGYKKMSGVAPIRENLAAGLFYALWNKTGGFDTLLDPMCGSGTLLLEGLAFYQPQVGRTFAIERRTQAAAGASSLKWAAPSFNQPKHWIGCDKDNQNLLNLRESLSAWLEQQGRGESPGLANVNLDVFTRDIFGEALPSIGPGRLGVLCNPPYGARLRLPQPPQVYYTSLLEKIFSLTPLGVGMILPKRYSKLVPTEFSGYKVVDVIHFENGGIPVEFRIYMRG